jgi:hypothetical protein
MTFQALAILPSTDNRLAVIVLVHIFIVLIFDELLNIQKAPDSIPTVATNLKNKNNKKYISVQ